MSDPDAPDPFAAFDSERTIIKPSAGRAARAPTATPAGAGAMPAAMEPGVPAAGRSDLPPVELPGVDARAGLNPLVQLAAPLLGAAPRLRATVRHANPGALRASLVDAVQRFVSAARAQGLPNEQVVAARYVLCTLMDEAASSTPWGGSGAWWPSPSW